MQCTLVNCHKVLYYFFLLINKWNKEIYRVTGSTNTYKSDATITKIFSKHLMRYTVKALVPLLIYKEADDPSGDFESSSTIPDSIRMSHLAYTMRISTTLSLHMFNI